MVNENIKIHKTKYKSSAKEKRKALKRANITGALITPRDVGEEQPSFFSPARTKLYVKLV